MTERRLPRARPIYGYSIKSTTTRGRVWLHGFWFSKTAAWDHQIESCRWALENSPDLGGFHVDAALKGGKERSDILRLFQSGRFWRNGLRTFVVRVRLEEV